MTTLRPGREPLTDAGPDTVMPSEYLPVVWGGEVADEDAFESEASTVRREAPKVGRNEPCPCGSGRKYKQCCGAADRNGH